MNTRRLSPTANLLRTSRLFSLPPPLPTPSQDFLATSRFNSETATLPYPTRAAIETSPPSLARGDWGLKRSLPRKSTAVTSTPLIRIGDIDSIDHVTDFESAADHTLTLRKWQEMNVSVSTPLHSQDNPYATRPAPSPKSVFDSDVDNTESSDGIMGARRWKFKGPWLAGKTEGKFQEYVETKIKKRKLEFREFLRESLESKMKATRKEEATNLGQDTQQDLNNISNEDLDWYIRKLRQDPRKLRALVERFLDLPNYTELSGTIHQSRSDMTASSMEKSFKEHGPPQTHPSAGLSYLRTSSHIHNHPILGPQEVEPPVPGRVLRPQTDGRGHQSARAIVGIGGVVTADDRVAINMGAYPPGVVTYDPDVMGGTKVWHHPELLSINSQGRIRVSVHHADQNTLAIYEGFIEEEGAAAKASIVLGGDRTFPVSNSSTSSKSPIPERKRSTPNYGLGGTSRMGSGSRAKPFEGKEAETEDVLKMLKFGLPNKR